MKRLHTFIALITMMMAVGCSYNELPEEMVISTALTDQISLSVETRAETYEGFALDQDYFVTVDDLENFVKFRRSSSEKSNLSVKEVKPYGLDSSHTLFYILNYDEGWEVVAADKRVQPTLAHGDSGTFTMDCDNEPMKFWMNLLADGVLQTRRRTTTADIATTATSTTTSTDSFDVVKSSEEQYVDFWDGISPTENCTKGDQIIGPITPPDDTPHFQYLITTEQETVYIQNGPLLETRWGQNHPWNAYCPLKTNGSGLRAPAGCVPVAGAQAIYYLQDYFNLNVLSPTQGTCTGNINDFNQSLTNPTFSAWNDMTHYITSYGTFIPYSSNPNLTALLIAYVGLMVEVDFGNNSSGADTMDLPDKVFDYYGIDCNTTTEYDSGIIIQNIQNQLPIIMRGVDAMLFGEGHAWVLDGYRQEVTRTTKYYFRSLMMLTPAQLKELDKTDANQIVVEDSLVAEKIHMNWGWDGSQNGWFSLLPENWWLIDDEGDDFRLRYYIKMIYDFQPKNQ